MGKGRNKKKKAPPAAAPSPSHVAVNGNEPHSGDAIQPPMPNPVGAVDGDEPPPESAAVANVEHAAPPMPTPVAAPDGDKSPVGSPAAANRDGAPPSRPTVETSNSDEMPSIEAANGGGPSANTGSEDRVPEERRDSSPEHEVEKLKALNGTLVKEALVTRGLVATLTTQVDQRSADAGALADLERVVFRAALVAPLQAAAEDGMALRRHLADAQQSLQVAEPRVARETDARVEAAARLEATQVDKLEVEELLRGKQAEATSASENVTQLEASVGELAGESTELCAEKGELQKQLGEMSATAHSVNALKAQVEGNLHDYKKSTEIWRQEMMEKLDEKSRQLDGLRSSEAEMEVKIQSLEAKLSAAQARNRELQLEMETSKTELHATQKEVEKLQTDVANATSKYNIVVADVDSFRNEINKMRKTKEAAAAAFGTEKTKLDKELDGLKRRVEKIQANKDVAMASVQQKDAEAVNLRAELNGLRGTIADQLTLCDDPKNKYSSLLAVKVALLKALGKEKAEGDTLRLTLAELESYNAEKEREIGVLKAEAENKEGQIGGLNGKLQELHLAVAEARQRGKSIAWTWLCPTTTVIAAASFVYAARSRSTSWIRIVVLTHADYRELLVIGCNRWETVARTIFSRFG